MRARLAPGPGFGLLLSLLAAAGGAVGCVETDGPPIGSREQPTACPAGHAPRQSVSPDIIAAFYPCCDGTAHLIPDFLVPRDFRAMLEAGPNSSLCVPDEFSTDAAYTPRECTSVFGLPGACLSTCIPQVRDAPVALPRDVCTGNRRCAPCIDPQTDQPSGACDQGAMACDPPADDGPCHDFEPTLDVSGYPSCGARAHCAPETLVAEDQRADLARCADGTSYCVPDDFLRRGGRYTPPLCASVGGREGRCLSTALPQVAAEQASLPVATCNPIDEVCVPCYDPLTGMGTGACTKGYCDPGPTQGPQAFEECGASGGDAYCVPADLVPASDRANFDGLGCRATPCSEGGAICVPRKIIDAGPSFSPRRCTNSLTAFLAFFLQVFKNPIAALLALHDYSEGRCLSRCLPQVRPKADLLGHDGCDPEEACVPCYDPEKVAQGKVPTGACDR
jgi:hypothetical protein